MRRGGFTLAEMTVVMFLSVVVFFLIAQLVIPSLVMFRTESATTDAQQAAFIFTHRLRTQLLNTQVETVTISEDPVAISFQEVLEDDPFDALGETKLSDYFKVYYWDETNKLVKYKEFSPTSPAYDFTDRTKPQRLSLADLQAEVAAETGNEQVVARHVAALLISDEDGVVNIISPPIKLDLTCAVESPRTRKEETYQMQMQVNPRNVRW